MMQKLTIVHSESHRQWSGQEIRVFHEARWMAEQGHRVVILAPETAPLYEQAKAADLVTYPVMFARTSFIKDYLQVRHLLKKIEPDVLNTHGNMDAKVVLTAARGQNIKCVIRSRHYLAPVTNSFYNRLLYGSCCHYIFTTAEKTSRQLIQDLALPTDKVITMPSGIVPPGQLDERNTARIRLCRELGIDEKSRFVGYVGRIAEDKGLLDLLSAFAMIYSRNDNLHLMMVGEGDFAMHLKGEAEKLGVRQKVHLIGFRNNPWPIFSACDCYVQASSRSEGVPQSVLQAMYAKTPVVGTDVGGIPDVVFPDKTGLLIAPNNPDELAASIADVFEKPDITEKRVAAAYQMVCEKHLLDTMGHRILAVYERRLNG
jgi:glycosyltransferase involved in cell wall biosynthesis